jgi:hypothetical protein
VSYARRYPLTRLYHDKVVDTCIYSGATEFSFRESCACGLCDVPGARRRKPLSAGGSAGDQAAHGGIGERGRCVP